MHIVILTAGSRGDVQPFIALGEGLVARGYQVTLGAPAMFESFVADYGVPFAPLDDEFLKITETPEGAKAVEGGGSLGLIAKVKPMLRRLMDDALKAAEDADLIIYHPKVLGAPYIADARGIPAILSLPLPAYTPTAEFPNPIMPIKSNIGFVNKLTYGVLKLVKAPYLDVINDFRVKSLGLPKTGRFSDDLKRADGSPIPVMYPVSRHVIPVPADYPPHVTMTGYWFLPAPTDYTPPADLTAFLDAGDPPVYVGFGSMISVDPQAKARLVIEALQRANVRGVIASGWGAVKLDPADLPPTIFALNSAPHDWLFPRMAAVVHHGGSGTTASGLRAGVPNVIVPFLGDQPFWGQRVHALGAGPAPILNKNLTADALTEAIRAAVTDSTMRDNAARVGNLLRDEDGIGNAVAFIERHAHSSVRV